MPKTTTPAAADKVALDFIDFPPLTWTPIQRAGIAPFELTKIGLHGDEGHRATLVAETPTPGSVPQALVERLIETPIRQTLEEHLAKSEDVQRYREVLRERDAIRARQVEAEDRLARLRLDRDLAEKLARPGWAAELVRLDAAAVPVEKERQAAAAELVAVAPAIEAAHSRIFEEIKVVAWALDRGTRESLAKLRAEAVHGVAEALTKAVSESLSKFVMLDALIGQVPSESAIRSLGFSIASRLPDPNNEDEGDGRPAPTPAGNGIVSEPAAVPA